MYVSCFLPHWHILYPWTWWPTCVGWELQQLCPIMVPWSMTTVPRRNLGSPMDCSHKDLSLGAPWYQGLWSWSIIVPQLMYSLSLDPLLEIHVRASSKFPKSLVSCNLPHILILTFKTTLVVLWTSCKLMCSTHFFFHYLTQGFWHIIILGQDSFKGEWL